MDNQTPGEQYHGDWLYGPLIVGRTASDKVCYSPQPELIASDTAGDALVGLRIACAPRAYIQLSVGDDQDRVDVAGEGAGPGDC